LAADEQTANRIRRRNLSGEPRAFCRFSTLDAREVAATWAVYGAAMAVPNRTALNHLRHLAELGLVRKRARFFVVTIRRQILTSADVLQQ